MARIFINYRRADSQGHVGRLYDQLLNYYDRKEIFLDVEAIQGGEIFESVIMAELYNCEVFIPVIGPQWLNIRDSSGAVRLQQSNDYVRREINGALEYGKIIIPVLVERAQMPRPNQLPSDLHRLCKFNAIELSHQGFGNDVEILVDAIGGGYGLVQLYHPKNEPLYTFKPKVKFVQADDETILWSPIIDKVLNKNQPSSWTLNVGNKSFVSRKIAAGRHTVKAELFNDNGKTYVASKNINLKAGQTIDLIFVGYSEKSLSNKSQLRHTYKLNYSTQVPDEYIESVRYHIEEMR